MPEPKRKVVSSFEDWGERIKSEVMLPRPDGDIFIPVRAVSENERVEINKIYRDVLPAKPKLSLDHKGNVRNNGTNSKADAEYEDQKQHAALILQMLFIEKGCDWDIPGKDYNEKLKSLGNKVSGEIDKLHLEIMKISRLTNEDVGYF